ncbi:tail fiber domain-containing protein [Microbulbifer sp. CAU 1566]|uniref:tail fiber domain-containing protein n=1 Tax=Microbulbifer sp. CAU 1566 TaxID=2933269 RepID=UPI0020035701|nr:tail fiber domain-containing protein [Microbulbifer sp. CAU 1566]MCK7597218.1 tail fiber domain-containing protein [Microbulbifer sp. CAU 1566]
MKIKTNVSRLCLAIALASTASAANATKVFSEDVHVQGSECVGGDCAAADAFGFDTFRLKENNLRIHFDDTSGSANFPKNDWRIVVNDTNTGGDSHFTIEDSTAGKTPFRIEAGAKSNTLVVDSAGMVGFGTDSPEVSMHAVSGDSPSIRLEQDGSSGWSAQRWDIVGNEANFFLRDATTGSKLPFRVKPYSPTDSLYIQPNYVYFGNKVYIKENTDQYEPRMEVENTNAVNYTAMRLTTPLDSIDLASSANEFQVNFANTGISDVSEMSLDKTGTLTIQGNLVANGITYTSSRAAKANFANVNADEILAKVDQLDVLSWNYNRDPESIRHIGPMAEDFHKQFGLNGDKDGVISASDVNGVALAAIKALKSRSDSLEQELDQKDQEIEGLRRAVDELRAAIAR